MTDNPWPGLLPPKAKKRAKPIREFTDEEAAAILEAARLQTGFLCWVPWLLCHSGARVGEIAQATTADITIGPIPTIRIHDDEEGRSLKNAQSRRTVPLHPAVISEGFLDIAALPTGSPLWPELPAGGVFGSRAQVASQRMSRWLTRLGIADKRLSPSHSWRHWFITAARKAHIPEDVRDAITGHAHAINESAGYGTALGELTEVLAKEIAKVRSPLG